MSRLQSVQNAAARLVACIGRREHITPVLRQLHWLPVCQRVQFKLVTLVYRSLTGTAPAYLLWRLSSHNVCWSALQPTPGHVLLVAVTTTLELGVLPKPVLVCGTVCRSNFDSQTFRLLVLKLYWRLCLSDWVAALCDWSLKAPFIKRLLTYLHQHCLVSLHCILQQLLPHLGTD